MMSISIQELRSKLDQLKPRNRDPESVVAFLLESLDVSKPAVPVQLIAENLGLRVFEAELDSDVSGALIMQPSSVPLIAVNSHHSEKRKRFTIAHEIGHFALKHPGMKSHVDRAFTVIHRDRNSSTATDLLEIQANRFAAALLMPTSFIIKEFGKFGMFDEEIIKKLSERYAVSTLALRIRLSNLGFYTPVE